MIRGINYTRVHSICIPTDKYGLTKIKLPEDACNFSLYRDGPSLFLSYTGNKTKKWTHKLFCVQGLRSSIPVPIESLRVIGTIKLKDQERTVSVYEVLESPKEPNILELFIAFVSDAKKTR